MYISSYACQTTYTIHNEQQATQAIQPNPTNTITSTQHTHTRYNTPYNTPTPTQQQHTVHDESS